MSMASPRPQLSLDELRRLKWLLGGAVALVSLWTVFFLDVEALALVSVASAVVGAALVWPQLPARLPALVWRLSVPAIIVTVLTDLYFSREVLPALIRLGVLLVLYRAVAYRRKREDLQLIVLGLFLIVVAGVLTVSLGFAALLLVFTACTLGFLFVVTLIDMVDTGPRVMRPEEMREVPAWARGGWLRLLRRLRQVADWRLMAFAGGLFVVVVGMSAVLFLIIPRFELASGFFLDKYITRKSRTGFSETVRFGDVSQLVRDESVAMRVDLTDPASVREAPYWRLVVLDEYTPDGFKVSTGLKNELLRTQRVAQILRGGSGNAFTRGAVGGVWTLYVEPGVSRFLPLPGGFGLMRLRESLPVQQSYGLRLVALRTEAIAMTAFQIEGVDPRPTIPDAGMALFLRGRPKPVSANETVSERRYDPRLTLRGPQGAANEAALARMVREIAGENAARSSAVDFARRATDWLRARHTYALAAKIPSGANDNIVKWLESREPGFCEHFAAGLTVLCRAAGYPARMIAGFHGGTLNGYENYFMVKNSDAHAWAEVFDGTGVWLRVDPTPGAVAAGETENATAGARQEQDSSWSARFDSLRVLWYRRVVNFDSRQQVQMMEDVRSFTSDTGAALRAKLEAVTQKLKAWLAAPWSTARAGKLLALAAAIATLVWTLLRIVRRGWLQWQTWRRPGQFDPVRIEAGRWLARLRQSASDRWQVAPLRRGYEGQASDKVNNDTVVAELQRLRYGHKTTWPEPAAVFRRARKARRATRR